MVRLAYLDTSAALKLVVLEPGRDELLAHLSDPKLTLTASWLLYTEMLCAAGRRPEQLPEQLARQALDQVEFVDLSRRDLTAAGRHAPLRSNHAIHLEVALRLEVDELISYDRELITAAHRLGLSTASPGAQERIV